MKKQPNIILAVYVNVGNMKENTIDKYISKFADKFKTKGVTHYFIPIREGETRVELVYAR